MHLKRTSQLVFMLHIETEKNAEKVFQKDFKDLSKKDFLCKVIVAEEVTLSL